MLYLYFRLIRAAFKSQMQYRASFLLLMFSYFIATSVDILGIWVLFQRFKIVKGWSFEEITLLYGVVHISFSIAESLARGFDSFHLLIKTGDFDRLLLRPLSTLFQVATRDVQLMRLGRLIQGSVVLIWGFQALNFDLFSLNTLVIILALIGTTSLFYGLIIVQGTIAFWTIETLEMMNITTFGGVEAGQYPLSIYHPLFRAFFTFIVPLGVVSYFPLATIVHHENLPIWLVLLFPLAGLLFFKLACRFWNLGVSHYQSTGN